MKIIIFFISFFIINYSFSQNINLKELLAFKTMSYDEIDTFLSVRNFDVGYDFFPSNNKSLFASRDKYTPEVEFLSFKSKELYLFPDKYNFLYITSSYKHYLSLLKQIKNSGFIELKSKDEWEWVGKKLFKKLDVIIETSISNLPINGVPHEYEFFNLECI